MTTFIVEPLLITGGDVVSQYLQTGGLLTTDAVIVTASGGMVAREILLSRAAHGQEYRLYNSGFVYSDGTAIEMSAANEIEGFGRITNYASGVIQGRSDAIDIIGSEALDRFDINNAGQISALTAIKLGGSGEFLVANTGTISAAPFNGAAIEFSGNTRVNIANSGTINGSFRGEVGQLTLNSTSGQLNGGIDVATPGATLVNLTNTVLTGNIEIEGSVFAGAVITIGTGSTVTGKIESTAVGNNTIAVSGEVRGDISMLGEFSLFGGLDNVTVNAGGRTRAILLGDANDSLRVEAGGIVAAPVTAVNGGNGDDSIVNGGSITGNVDFGLGRADLQNVGTITGNIVSTQIGLSGTIGTDVIKNSGTINGNLNLGGRDSVVENSGLINGFVLLHDDFGGIDLHQLTNAGTITSNVIGGFDEERIVNRGSIGGSVELGGGANFLQNQDGASIGGSVNGGDAVDDIENAGIIGKDILLLDGQDLLFNKSNGQILGVVSLGAGGDSFTNWGKVGGGIGGSVFLGEGSNFLLNGLGAVVTNSVVGGSGGNTLINDGSIGGLGVVTGSGNDTLDNAGSVTGVNLGDATNRVTNSAGGIVGARGVRGGAGDDTVENSGRINAGISLGDGANTLTNDAGGVIAGPVVGGIGIDSVDTSGGTILGRVDLGGGNDTFLGGDGIDKVRGGLGDDTLDGGVGTADIAYFSGNRADYVIQVLSPTTLRLHDNVSGRDGSDDVLNIERFVFADGVVTLAQLGASPGGIFGTTGDDALIAGTALADTIYGLAGSDIIQAGNGSDSIYGGAGNDTSRGGLGDDVHYFDAVGDAAVEFANEGTDTVSTSVSYTARDHIENVTLTGAAGNAAGNALGNVLTGNALNNLLIGRGGNDTLIGGSGRDTYMLDAPLSVTNVDRIVDFNAVDDVFRLSASVFGAAGPGVLGAGAFVLGTAAVDADDRIMYDTATGSLWFDADGSDVGVAQLFAVLESRPLDVSASDFVVV